MNHPKIRTDDRGDLYLNFGEYGCEVEVAAFSGDGRRLLAVQEVGVARVWDVDSGQRVGEIRPDSLLAGKKGVGPASGPFLVFIEAAALDRTGEVALLGLNDGTAGLFSVADGERRTTFHHPDRPPAGHWELIRAVNFSPDGSLAVVGFFDRCVGVWDVRDYRPVAFLRSDLGSRLHRPSGWARDTLVSSVAVSADNRFVFAGHADMTATLWDLATGKVVQDAFEHQEEVLALWHGDGIVRWATSGGVVWEAASRQPSAILRTDESWQEAAFAPDGQSILARTGDGRVQRHPLAGEATCLARLEMGKGWIGWSSSARTLAFAPGGRAWLYPVARDGLALADTSGVRTLRCNVQSVLTTFSEDGRLLAT
jgi:WD40 repeat protein